MRNLLLTICYDGSRYHGWQVQHNAYTVQAEFQRALGKILSDVTEIKGCSRTDSGVHANMYCISFKTNSKIKCENLVLALNTKLARDVAALSCKEVDESFHARYNVKYKEYIYKVYNSPVRSPFLNDYAYHYKYKIDEKLLDCAAKAFIGKYDYSAFCSAHSNSEKTVKDVKSFEVTRAGDMVLFTVSADGFLYNMVRIMVGTLLFVNEGKINPAEIKSIIESKDRKMAGKTAPPQGLYLNKVYY
ncbi:MAG: tRNA pseudouridine(38-40) synthase TruA [Clostridiales bacterium]|nr:tRNA pseudouridine(38-40) synthase TruA [Clostridiales bacterium]